MFYKNMVSRTLRENISQCKPYAKGLLEKKKVYKTFRYTNKIFQGAALTGTWDILAAAAAQEPAKEASNLAFTMSSVLLLSQKTQH